MPRGRRVGLSGQAGQHRYIDVHVDDYPSKHGVAVIQVGNKRYAIESHSRLNDIRISGQVNGQPFTAQIERGTVKNPLALQVQHNGTRIETLPAGENLGQIDDLKYFNNKMARGLRVPSSYLPTGPDDSDRVMNDGKVGTALIQEYRFNQYCERLQKHIIQKLDDEFKMFLKWRGFNIDSSLFNIKFCAPQNFASYRQSELDTARIQSFSQVEQLPYMSKRFMMQRFLGLSEDEIKENARMWREERSQPEVTPVSGPDLRSVGVTPGGMESDIGMAQDVAGMGDLGAAGAPGAPGTAAPGAAPGGALPGSATPPAASAAPSNANPAHAISVWALQLKVLRNRWVWMVALASGLFYVTRYAINSWGIFFLQEAKGYSTLQAGSIISVSAVAGLAGTAAFSTEPCSKLSQYDDSIFCAREYASTIVSGS